ncbi:long-chain fatty acid transporter fat1 [Bulinus truncatus]|nr:long-chain fatty acid transporter fat1 [Bulinus truncatus]
MRSGDTGQNGGFREGFNRRSGVEIDEDRTVDRACRAGEGNIIRYKTDRKNLVSFIFETKSDNSGERNMACVKKWITPRHNKVPGDGGTIRTSQVLDRETTPHYWLTVLAQDRALVPKFARLEVLIEVADINDNIPQSVEPAYYASENLSIRQRVVQIQATDGDDHVKGPTFAITSGNSQNLFEIDPVTVTRDPDFNFVGRPGTNSLDQLRGLESLVLRRRGHPMSI